MHTGPTERSDRRLRGRYNGLLENSRHDLEHVLDLTAAESEGTARSLYVSTTVLNFLRINDCTVNAIV